MKISFDWLKQHIDIEESITEVTEKLTKSGLEVEGIEEVENIKGSLAGLVIGEVKTCTQHPNADKLSLTTVDLGAEELVQIVCGAPNVAAGQKVVVAPVGSTVYPSEGEPFKIKKGKIRGELSFGMICAEDEIGLGQGHDGIMVLDTDVANGTLAADFFEITTEQIIEIGLTPNRADATSHYGVAREVQALYHRSVKDIDVSAFKVDNQDNTFNISVENTEACPRYSGVSISGVRVEESPEWLKKRLNAMGINPTNNVVDITNFILHDLGQPLHAFDADKITSKNVVIKTLAQGTTFTTLDEVERKLDERDLMICNGDEPMCIAGVFGGLDSGVTESTTNIFLESAYFSPNYVRKTSLRHGLKTDASFRFERGTDPNMVITALKKAAILIQEIAGGTITSEIIDQYPNAIENFEVEVSYAQIFGLIGKNIGEDTTKGILENLDITITSENDGVLTLSVPPYRVDVQRPADIVEEVLRIYGYDNIELSDSLSSDFLAPLPKNDIEKKKAGISQVLTGKGFNEIITNSLTKPAYTADNGDFEADKNVVILNKLSEDLEVMRQSLLFHGLEVLSHNINRKQSNVKAFEFGKIYQKLEDGYHEEQHLAIFLTGNQNEESWRAQSQKVDFHDLATTVQMVFKKLNLPNYTTENFSNETFSKGLKVFIHKNTEIARLGFVSKKVRNQIGVKQDVLFADIDFDKISTLKQKNITFEELSKFPAVRRDLSLVLNKNTSFREVEQIAYKFEKKILKQVNVFDTYEGKPLEDNQKSYSVSFILQDAKQTLNDKTIDKTMNKLMNAYEKELGAIIKGK
ncbi:MAG: phenylalanine--tRNA ligase subunit beta [Cytophagales bacterium]|nr:phenylalanine--tRNA ligase subunit beta [Cytophagales bacterium]